MSVVVVGPYLSRRDSGIRAAIERASERAVFIASPASLSEVIVHGIPRCVFVHSGEVAQEVSLFLRARAECSSIPIVALVETMSEQLAIELHRLGADDIASLYDVSGMVRRLGALSQFDPQARAALSQGACLLAHPDTHERQMLGRVLRQAGFDVLHAQTADDACQVAERCPPKVIVVSDKLPPSGGEAALGRLSRHWLGNMPAVLLRSEDGAAPMRPSCFHELPASGAPYDLLFVVNELLRPREQLEARASRRLLSSVLCAFRPAGELEHRFGLSYNISREGLYVRTFDAPPERGPVWLELRPQGARAACHLRASVVWTRPLATGARGSVPPGFGVRLLPDECPQRDYELYLECYEALLAERSAGARWL